MKEPELKDWACRLLEDQLMRLAELRNANPRDPGFKLWRQTTLTVIQRVWPGNLQRSERFRRVPFTPSTARPTRTQVREHFERGCGEATGYLRELISQIKDGALDSGRTAEPAAPSAPPQGLASVSAALAAPLPGEMPRTPPPDDETPPLQTMAKLTTEPPPIPGFQASSQSAAPGAAPPPSPLRPPAGRPVKSPRKSERRALKDMLGFGDDPSAGPAPAPEAESLEAESLEAERPGASFGQPPPIPEAPGLPMSAGHLEPLEQEPLPLAPAAASPPMEELLPLVDQDAIRPLREIVPMPIAAEQVERLGEDEPPFGEEPLGETPLEMIPLAPSVVQAEATATTAAAPTKAAPRSPVAIALHALAGEVEGLGVPEGKRAAARAALTDLARQIEERTADWDTLRDAFNLAMDYPPLARRVVPLLVPFLDLE